MPTQRGFDSYYGFLSGCEDHVNQLNCCGPCDVKKYGIGKVIDLFEADNAKNTSGPAVGKNGTNNMYGFTQHAVDKIAAHDKARPFFLYAALHNTHAPFEVPPAYEALYNHSFRPQNVWSGMVSAVDESVGNITAALKASGMWDNTLLVFATDNGSPVCGWGASGSNAPLRGGKASDWEGGVRVPGVVGGGWTGLPAAARGTTTRGLVHISDWYKTFAAVAGADGVDGGGPSPQDSIDLSGWLLSGKAATTASPRNMIVHDHYCNGCRAKKEASGGGPTSGAAPETAAAAAAEVEVSADGGSDARYRAYFEPYGGTTGPAAGAAATTAAVGAGAGTWATLPGKALTCSSAEFKGSLGTKASAADCLAALQARTDADYGVWRGDPGSNKGCYACDCSDRGDPSTWKYAAMAGAASFVGTGVLVPTPAPPPTPPPFRTNATGAIRVGDWKLMVGAQPQATWFGDFSPNATFNGTAANVQGCTHAPCLFNISADPTEHDDVAAQFPDVVAQLLATFHTLDYEYHGADSQSFGGDQDGYCAAAANNSGFMVPWRDAPVGEHL